MRPGIAVGEYSDGPWVRIDVSTWPVIAVETQGSTQNLWLAAPDRSEWLHKDTTIPGNGIEQGEDWSEVVSTNIAGLLGVPCAQTRMCTRSGRRGSISLSVREPEEALWEGDVVLSQAKAANYYPHTEGHRAVDPTRPGVKRPGHTLENIRDALHDVMPPPSFEGPKGMTAFDVFAGYTILDALIANSDRHEQNWGVLTPPLTTSPARLAPSYDHASSLGFNLTDQERQRRLSDRRSLEEWAEKGTAKRFEHVGKPDTLVMHAVRAFALSSSTGRFWWSSRLAELDLTPVLDAVRGNRVSGMSDLAATFVERVLRINERRLRDAVGVGAP